MQRKEKQKKDRLHTHLLQAGLAPDNMTKIANKYTLNAFKCYSLNCLPIKHNTVLINTGMSAINVCHI